MAGGPPFEGGTMSTTAAAKQDGGRAMPDVVSYAVGHRIRVELLAALNDLGSASTIELARIVHQPLSTVTHHIGELLKAGSIFVERTEKVRSVEQRFYSTVKPLYITDEEMQEMSEEDRVAVAGITLQAMIAESLSAFWAGHLTTDPRIFLCWSWFNVDAKGRAEIADEQLRSWKRIREIEREAQERCEETGDEPFSVFVSSSSFNRSRTALRPPDAPDAP